jgi:AraC-like DNA-binding protein
MIQVVPKRDSGHSCSSMPTISIPFTVFLAMLFISLRVYLRMREARGAWPFLVLALALTCQAMLVSLRWDVGFTLVRPVQVILSVLIPALAWFSFKGLGESDNRDLSQFMHLIPAGLVAVALAFLPDAIDVIIIATYLAYGAAFVGLCRKGSNDLAQVAFESTQAATLALWLVTFTLFGSALVDLLVSIDFAKSGGKHVPVFIGFGNLLWLVVLGGTAAVASHSLPDDENEEAIATSVSPDETEARVAATVDSILRIQHLYKDANLTLIKLARKAGIPARQISSAINRVHKQNMSQYVNVMRIEEACRLLKDTTMPVTSVIFESGFQTKSNFNREFLRVTGKSPRDWRSNI